ncbi:hypothetical protein DFJ74DRAFT_652110 [Hyaloraphidium curvatum]|nr:hypothetical protein DFJ74DRAFT_652110 [Hyaloraphidium curvatum]
MMGCLMRAVLAAAFVIGLAQAAAGQSAKKVLLRDVETLTLYRGKWTTARRGNPVKQISCIKGDACELFVPDVIQCRNMGWDGTDVTWKCHAEMDEAFRFGETTVSCEGYSRPDDPYILGGSCGVEYALYLTQKGKEWKNRNAGGGTYGGRAGDQKPRDFYNEDEVVEEPEKTSFLGNLIFYAMAAFFLYTILGAFCFPPRGPQGAGAGRGGSGGGGGPGPGGGWGPGGGGGYPGGGGPGGANPPPPGKGDDPPPYTAYPSSSSYSPTSAASSSSSGLGTAGTFLAGAAAGGLLSSMFGRNREPQQQQRQSSRTMFGHRSTSPSAPPASSFGSSSFGSSSSSSFTGTSHTSTGYGGTRRR